MQIETDAEWNPYESIERELAQARSHINELESKVEYWKDKIFGVLCIEMTGEMARREIARMESALAKDTP